MTPQEIKLLKDRLYRIEEALADIAVPMDELERRDKVIELITDLRDDLSDD